jgi:hypothetical protein
VSSIVTVSAGSQDVTLEFSSGETAQASFHRFGPGHGVDPDCLIWDIVGGNVWEVQFEALTRVSGLQQ